MPIQDTLVPLFKSRTLATVALYACVMGLYSLLAVGKEHSRYAGIGDFPAEIHAALTLVLGWLLVFRTNAAYARWWEARTLWGSLVNSSRNLAIKLFHLLDLPLESRRVLENLIVSFPKALRDHLRRKPPTAAISELVAGAPGDAHVPVAIVTALYDEFDVARRQSKMDGDELRVIDVEAKVFLDVCGACERILNTRVARSYRVFARQCIALYLFTFPWGIVETFRWWTVPLTVITSYFMLGMEIVAEHIEEPFGYDDDDLNLDAICEGIEKTVKQIAGTPRPR